MRRKADYHFDLPQQQIAQAPAKRRDASRLLVIDADALTDRNFVDLERLVPEGAVVVVNDTKVRRARLRTRKSTGGVVELLVLEPAGDPAGRHWRCMARSSKPVRQGAVLHVDTSASDASPTVRVITDRADDGTLVVELDRDVDVLLAAHGDVPLPPYIGRPGGASQVDGERYQTVYARVAGAVAAPTAGLHFTEERLDALRARGCHIARLTLHVGLGTFAPIRVDDLDQHVMHEETYELTDETWSLVTSGRPVVAVGTTVVRALESAAAAVAAGQGRSSRPTRTRLFIRPGYRFRVVDHLLTNFHLPESSLLMLVCAFAGYDRTLAAYRHAVTEGYRFFSYGDAMFLSRKASP